jgi:CDP-diglyceride synthetase
MSILEAAATAIGETIAYVVGRIAGRTFRLAPKTAQSVGESVVFGVIVGAATVVTVIYS